MNKTEARLAARKMRMKLEAQRRQKKQEEKDERLLARWILFAKGRGKDKNLNEKDSKFVNSVVHKAYDRYMSDLTLGTKLRVGNGKLRMTTLTPSRPPSFSSYRRIWYGASKFCYIRNDVPRLMNMKMEMLRNGRTDTEVPKLCGRYMQELQHEISERERRNMDIPVLGMHTDSGGVEGRHPGQKPIRERRKEKAGSNRDAATLGEA